MVEKKIEKEIAIFISILKVGNFRDAHEVLENSWRENRTSVEGKVLKGLINGATALELRRLGRNDAEKRVWRTFDKFMPLLKDVKSLQKSMQVAKDFIDFLRSH
jgi:hypothetical protein